MEKKEIFFTDLEIYDDIELNKFFEVCSKMVNDYKKSCLKNWEINNVPEEKKIKFSDKVIVKKKEEWDYNSNYSRIVLELYRWETDKEYEKRLETNRKENERREKAKIERRKKQEQEKKKLKELKKDKDYKLYLSLKEKFE